MSCGTSVVAPGDTGGLGDEVEAVPLHESGSVRVIHAGPPLLVGAACALQSPPSLLPLHSALVQAAVLSQEVSLNLLSNELLGTNLGVEVKPDISIYTRPLG